MIALNEPHTSGRYEPGALIRHRRYGYRGVVVSVDAECQADNEWYQKNQTQPDRNQSWHHVLVHETSTVTYAAGENLQPDDSTEEIQNPLVPHFFTAFDGVGYVRNSRPWPGG